MRQSIMLECLFLVVKRIIYEELNHDNSEVIKIDEGEYHYVLLVKTLNLPKFDANGEEIE